MRLLEALLRRWHDKLGLSRQNSRSWHINRIREERGELHAAKTNLEKISEASDVFFSISRSRYDGFPLLKLPHPVTPPCNVLVYVYMVAKFTLRWMFYRRVATYCHSTGCKSVREVVNPSKDAKLAEVASRHNIDPSELIRVARKLRRVWPLLP